MAGLRAYSPTIPDTGTLTLDPNESHHLVRVRRARVGDAVEVISGRGLWARCQLVSADARSAVLQVQAVSLQPPPPWRLTLAQALPKGKTMDAVVQRATELGADAIVPLFSDHSEVELDERRAEQKRQKWEQIALESAKQCGSPWLPQVTAPQRLSSFLAGNSSADQQLVAALTSEAQAIRLVMANPPRPASVVLLVGPEGDFSAAEYARIFEAGFKPVTLGPRVLRVETAACAILALALDALRAAHDGELS